MTEATQITADFSGAIRQRATTLKLTRAHKFVVTEWAADTVRILKMQARAMQRSGPGRKMGQLARNIGVLVGAEEERWTVVVGTGVGGTQSVPYAKIQDEGGTTHPRVTARMRRWAWFMYYKEQGIQRRALKKDFPNMPAAMRKETARMASSKYLGIALTKKEKLDVKIPATHWFSGVLEYRERDLQEMMSPEHVLKVAEGMAAAEGVK